MDNEIEYELQLGETEAHLLRRILQDCTTSYVVGSQFVTQTNIFEAVRRIQAAGFRKVK